MTRLRPSSRRSVRVWIWFAGSLALILLDQATKIIVRARLPLSESIPVVGGDFLRLTHVQNTGIAFGLQLAGPMILLVFGWIAAIGLAFYLYRVARESTLWKRPDGSKRTAGNPLRWPLMLFLAGAVGNSIDRLVFGQVTDFLDVDFPDWIMPRWPVFNVADSCVTIGIVLLLFIILFDRHRSRSALATSGSNTDAALPAGSSDDRTPRGPYSLPDHDCAGATPAAD